MLKKALINILESESLMIFKKFELELIDIILFGSVGKGKEKPNDIDILILFKKKINYEIVQILRRSLERKVDLKVEVTPKTYAQLFQKEFIAKEGLLENGFSLIYNVSFAEGLGYISKYLFTYKLEGKSKSERMRFYYALYGRSKGEGVLKRFKAEKYTDTVIICPVAGSEGIKDFFNYWKIKFTAVPILLPIKVI